MKLTKYYRVFMIKDLFQMMKFICSLIFIKIVLQVVKKFKNIVIIEKDCDNGKKLQQKKRFSQMIINKERFKKILTDDHKKSDSHR